LDNKAHLATLKRVGAVLVVIGLVDIAWMIYCIIHKVSYRSSLNLFAVIAGVLLMRGSLRTAATVRWFGVFLLSAGITMIVAWPAIQPLDLTLTRIRLDSGGFITGVAILVFILGLFYWVVRELGLEPVQVAIDSAGVKRRDMRFPAALGVALVLGIGISLNVFLRGASAERAKSIAETQLGPGYTLHVSSLSVSSGGGTESVSGIVTAWNDREIKDILVHWEENRD
jgi:hypothetical protein